jgi:hypothetical protein
MVEPKKIPDHQHCGGSFRSTEFLNFKHKYNIVTIKYGLVVLGDSFSIVLAFVFLTNFSISPPSSNMGVSSCAN